MTLGLAAGIAHAQEKWETYENCTLLPNAANDGDSFHVRAGGEEYIFRLYFADTPETDASVPERVAEQAKYFHVTIPQALQIGIEAERFTRARLARPFTVVTCKQDARGRSRLPRYFAFVEMGREDLAETLVANGLARVYGVTAKTPAGQDAEAEHRRLEQLESSAQSQKLGGWGIGSGRLNTRLAVTATAPPATSKHDSFDPFFHPAATPGQSLSAPGSNSVSGGKLDLNRASLDELESLPGIGPVPPASLKRALSKVRITWQKSPGSAATSMRCCGPTSNEADQPNNRMNDHPNLPIDFIGIGAPKCGTTWLSTQLEAHPQIGFAPDKEVYYFADTIIRRIAHKELGLFERGLGWYHEQFPPAGGSVTCRGEYCPAYLYSEQAAERIAAYRPDIKLLLCLRPPVEMIYSWYWYNRNAVVATLPESFSAMMENPFLRDLGCYARHLRPYLERFPAESLLVIQFEAIRRDPARVRAQTYEFLGVAAEFEPQLVRQGQNAARAPRFPLLQSSAQKLYETVSHLPVAGKVMKSAVVARTLQGVYHRLNSKARKYEPLPPEEKRRWESYYAEDQAELAGMLRNVRVIT